MYSASDGATASDSESEGGQEAEDGVPLPAQPRFGFTYDSRYDSAVLSVYYLLGFICYGQITDR